MTRPFSKTEAGDDPAVRRAPREKGRGHLKRKVVRRGEKTRP